MAITKRQFNWAPVTFTPGTGSALTATGVTQVDINTGGTLVKFAGDADRFNTTVVAGVGDPQITVTSADEAWVFACAPGARGTVAATHKDAKAATGGNITYTLAGAIAESPQAGGQFNQFGSGSVTFSAESADGTTNPLSFSLA